MRVDIKAVIAVDRVSTPEFPAHGAHELAALERVANRAILDHALDGLRNAGIDDVIVTGDADALLEVQSFFNACAADLRQIRFAVRGDDTSLNGTLEAVAPLVGESPCVIQPGDGLLEAPMSSLIEQIDYDSSESIVFASSSRGPARPYERRASRMGDGDGSSGGWSGLGLFGPGALRMASGAIGDGRRHLAVCQPGSPLPTVSSMQLQEITGWYRYQGNRRDLLELNRIALDRIVPCVPEGVELSSRVEGQLDIDPTATVRDSVIVGPVVIGPGAVIQDAYIGPWTSIGAGARVEGAEIERSIVAQGASITHVGARIVASYVGHDARVFRDFSLPRALRLWIGGDDEVALC
jgi:glucose-1-phosphate thymidylyltransferase